MSSLKSNKTRVSHYVIAGGIAGIAVDVSLFPIDTVKTRLQSSQGFRAAGGFRGVYAGLGSAVAGAAPGAAFFFLVYEGTKDLLRQDTTTSGAPDSSYGKWRSPITHIIASSLGEVAACTVRVPTEVVKQRAQALQHPSSFSSFAAVVQIRHRSGWLAMLSELYRGWGITLLREVPFTVIQFPLWETLKARKRLWTGQKVDDPTSSAIFGAASGAIAAAATTPLDVIKTRMMLSHRQQSTLDLATEIWRTSGPRSFFAGMTPRVLWISSGGAIFLGSYQFALNLLQP